MPGTVSGQGNVNGQGHGRKLEHGHAMGGEEGSLDRYASSYIPLWLRQVNDDPHFTLIPLPQEPNYDYDAFVSDFLPRRLIFSDPDDEMVAVRGDARSQQPQREGGEAELVKVDSSWLKGDTSLEGELESDPSEGAQQHASIGALSQEQEQQQQPQQQRLGDGGGGSIIVDRDPPLANTTVKITTAEILPSSPLPPLRPSTYAERLTKLLQVEYAHRRDILAGQSLFEVQLSIYPESRSGQQPAWSRDHLYSLRLPGVREDYPSLLPGDLLQLRALASNMGSWLKLAFEAKVYVVHKVTGVVIVRCDALSAQLQTLFPRVEAARFNILFVSSAFRGGLEAAGALEKIGRHLRRPQSAPGRVLRDWLFPALSTAEQDEQQHEATLTSAPKQAESIATWHDSGLNAEQRGIVHNVVFTPRRSMPLLVHGPPGTGKTKTLVETTLQILQHQSDARILLAAPSVTAADTLAIRLAAFLSPQQMTRINDARRTFEEVPEALLVYCPIVDDGGVSRFGLPSWEKLMRTQVVVIATHDVQILHFCKMSNRELGRWQGMTLSPMLGPHFKPRLHWTHLLVDEAGQSSEAEMASALLLVVPSAWHDTVQGTPVPAVVLCGDVAQLGPQIDSHFARSHGLDVSLLERLSKRKAYRRQMASLQAQARRLLLGGDYKREMASVEDQGDDKGEAASHSSSSSSITSGCAAHLVRNYRARNSSLLHVVSMLFYADILLPVAAPSQLLLGQHAGREVFPNPAVPMLLEHVDAREEWVDEGASFYNSAEIDRVVALCQSLLERDAASKGEGKDLRPSDIAVITPYREQVWRLRLKLRKEGLSLVSVGNVEVYQGAEHRMTIISTVRSSPRFLPLDARRALGLVLERKRLCVALSRAQEGLIVVGNMHLLRVDPYWRTLIAYARRNKCLRSSSPSPSASLFFAGDEGALDGEGEGVQDDSQIGALEYASRMQNGQPDNDTNTATAFLAGRMAASTLFDEEEDDEEDEDDDEEEERAEGM